MIRAMFIVFILVLFNIKIFSFPGDHNSLTCDKNFIGIPNVQILKADKITFEAKTIDEAALALCYRIPNTTADPNLKQCRANIVAAINADIAKEFSQSIVKQNIRSRNISNDNGRTIHVTKWGDILSDLVQVYGVMGPAYPSYETYKNQGRQMI